MIFLFLCCNRTWSSDLIQVSYTQWSMLKEMMDFSFLVCPSVAWIWQNPVPCRHILLGNFVYSSKKLSFLLSCNPGL